MRIYAACAVMLAFYLFPWLVNPSASLTPNAYALAEWTSLHPAVRDAAVPLLTSLLLRLPLACLALLVAFAARRGILPALVVLVIAAALLPPPQFVTALDDSNYRQLAALAVFTVIAGALGLSGRLGRYRRRIAVGVALVGALASGVGMAQSYSLMRGFDLPTQIGLGGVALVLAFVLVAVMMLWETKQGSAAATLKVHPIKI